MLIRNEEMARERKTEMRGGQGSVDLCHVAPKEALNGRGRLFSQITLEPGCSIGYHEHHGESELFYILCGTGALSDNGTFVTVQTGDCAVCSDGQGHSLENTGTEPLVLMALILFAGKK